MAIMEQYLLMGKPEQEKRTQWKETRQTTTPGVCPQGEDQSSLMWSRCWISIYNVDRH